MEQSTKKTPALVVALAWIMVSIPLGWGVYQSVVNSLPLFGVSHETSRGRH